jgi:Ca2+-binding RTX toxin-like protein
MTIYTGDAGNNTITGSSGDDFIDGREGNDTLNGGAGSDILVGGPGADILTGGSGADTFRGSAADLNGDHITDLLIGDRIQFLDLTLQNANFSIVGSELRYNGGSLQIDNIGPGRLVLRTITSVGV